MEILQKLLNFSVIKLVFMKLILDTFKKEDMKDWSDLKKVHQSRHEYHAYSDFTGLELSKLKNP